MIKIEFKEATNYGEKFYFIIVNWFTRIIFKDKSMIQSITHYIPTQDPYLDRSFILQQLGISKEQDEEMQEKYK